MIFYVYFYNFFSKYVQTIKQNILVIKKYKAIINNLFILIN